MTEIATFVENDRMKIFVTGISTDVGKTIVSAILTEALHADYWKPVQAGGLDHTDSDTVRELISNNKSVVHPERYRLVTPASPHLAASIDGIVIEKDKIIEPHTDNHLIVEGAGGLFVPINDLENVIDLIKPEYKVVIVSRHYLGSINHTLMTIETLWSRGIDILGIVFSGNQNLPTEKLILDRTGLKMIGRIDEEPYFDKNVVREYAEIFNATLKIDLL